MAIRTSLTDLLGIQHPIILAPMDIVADARLVAAVSDAGAFGLLGGGYANADWVRQEIGALAARAPKPRFGVGFITWVLAKRPHVLDIALEGNSISGTFIERRKYEGSACVSAGYTSDRSSTFAFTGKRTVEAPSSDTDLNGSWELTGEGSGKPLKATMNGLSADFDPGYSDGTKGTVTITNGLL